MDLWKETRTCINHLDKMIDGVRIRIFTFFGTITSVAAASYYWVPNVFIGNFRVPALIELAVLFFLIPSMFQHRLYHFWLFKAINTALHLENAIHPKIKEKGQKKHIMLTQSLTGVEERTDRYWQAMLHSKLFWVEMGMFSIMILACLGLSYIFSFPPPN